MNFPHVWSRWTLVAAPLLIISVAAGLRLYGLPEYPVGLHYDEAANGILAGEIAQGLKTPIFISAYTGKEVLFFYWTAIWMKLLGITTLSLRLSAATLGVVTVGVSVWAMYELLYDWTDGRWIALITAALLAVSFWHVVLSRYGFRAVAQPLLQAATVAALWRGIGLASIRSRRWDQTAWLMTAGLLFGLTAYTYLASRAFPVPVAVAMIALVVVDREHRRERLVQVGIFVGTAVLALAPLLAYWLTNPGSFTTRAKQVVAGSWTDIWNGLLACLKMLFLAGDPYIRFNLPGRPLFSPALAAFFLLGLGTAIWRLVELLRHSKARERPRCLAALVFILSLVPVMLLPSALATQEITPSNLRTVGLLPFIYAFPALGIAAPTVLYRRLGGDRVRIAHVYLPVACLLTVAVCGTDTISAYSAWSSSPALYYAADGDMAAIATYLNRSDLGSSKPYVASQHYRHPTVAFLAKDYDRVRWLVGGQSLVFPADGDALFLFPRSASQHLEWVGSMLPDDTLLDAPPGPDGAPAFHAYQAGTVDAPKPARKRTVKLGDSVQLLGYSVTNQPSSGDTVEITVWWKVTSGPDQPDYRSLARLVDKWGSVWSEALPLHFPSEQWKQGDLIVDHLSVSVPAGAPPGDYVLQFGLYAPGANVHLPVLDDRGAYAGLYAKLPVTISSAAKPVSLHELPIEHHLGTAIDGLTLLGCRLETKTARPGEPLLLTLFWKAMDAPLPSYELRLQVGDAVLHQGAPVHGTYPFSKWETDEVISDRYNPRLPLDLPPGPHALVLEIEGQTTSKLTLGEISVRAIDRNFEVPTVAHEVGISLGDSVELVGYNLSPDPVIPGGTLTLTLTWRSLTSMTTDYTVFAHLLGPDGAMTGQQDKQPKDGHYPTTLWAEDEIVHDIYNIPVNHAAPPGEHRLEVGMYVADTGDRLSIREDEDNAIVLQTVRIAE